MDPVLAPLDGSLVTLIDFVDFHVEQNPRSPWLVFPSTTSGDTISYISYTAMANASHRIASIVRPGRSGPDYQVVAVLLHTDSVIYVPILLGLWRAGYIVSSKFYSMHIFLIFYSHFRCHLAILRRASATCSNRPDVDIFYSTH